jgi:transcriptional regulator with XRE-family HTH domain
MNEQPVSHINFKQQRQAYKISLEEIAKKSGLAISTVSAYERFTSKYTQTRTRDENGRAITNALNDIIQEKIAETFPNATKKEDKVVEEVKEKRNYKINGFDRAAISEKIRKYCTASGISIREFCKMCDIADNTFMGCVIRDNPLLRKQTVNKIMNATGWSLDQLTGPDDISVKKAAEYVLVQNPVTTNLEPMKPNPIDADEDRKMSSLQHDGNVQITDEKYTFQDGSYYYEYTIVRRVKRKITKEQFLNDISKKEEN